MFKMGRASQKGAATAPARGGSSKWKVKEENKDDLTKDDSADVENIDNEPTYDKNLFLQVYQALKSADVKQEQVEEKVDSTSGAEEPAPAEEVSIPVVLGERPEPEGGAPDKTPGRRAQWEAKKAERAARRASEVEPGTPSGQKIALSTELGMPPFAPAPGTPGHDPAMLAHLQSMCYGPPPMMYGSGFPPPAYTTVMLRNIPNRYTRDMLVERLNEKYKGAYDFVYLPIDFNSKCNVGYAFINFTTPDVAAAFMQEYHGAKSKICLPGFGSTKTCEVCYARCQGRDANMENLRDDKFLEKLNERPEWQPLFYDDKGKEIPFADMLVSAAGKRRSRSGSSVSPQQGPAVAPPPPPSAFMPPYGMPGMMYPSPAMPTPEFSLATLLPHASPNTMLVLRGIPSSIKRDDLIKNLDNKFKGAYDFLYLPGDNSGKHNKTLAYINFRTVEKAKLFEQQFHNAKYFEADSEKECIVEKCRMGALEKSLKNLKPNAMSLDTLLSELATDKASLEKASPSPKKTDWHPVLFDVNGDPMPFPLMPVTNYGIVPFVDPARAAQMAKAAHEHARNAAVAHAGFDHRATGKESRSSTEPLDADKKTALKTQIEFYFSLENLCKDLYLRSQMDESGWISLHTISRFPKVQKFEASVAEIVEALSDSTILEVEHQTCCVRLKDESMRGQWARVPDDYKQSLSTTTR